MSILESSGAPPSPPSPALPPPSPGSKAWAFLRLLARPRFARKLGTLVTHGHLAEIGWVDSVTRDPYDLAAPNPVPWATFPFIAFLGPRLHAELRVFEYGAGRSTLYYAARVRSVTAVEHDAAFARALAPHLPPHATVTLAAERSAAYRDAILRAGGRFDLVIVDGRDRVRCVETALAALGSAGVLVLDDAERPDYRAATELLARAGFRRLDFWGLAPGVVGTKSTAVFYRPDNCLGL